MKKKRKYASQYDIRNPSIIFVPIAIGLVLLMLIPVLMIGTLHPVSNASYAKEINSK